MRLRVLLLCALGGGVVAACGSSSAGGLADSGSVGIAAHGSGGHGGDSGGGGDSGAAPSYCSAPASSLIGPTAYPYPVCGLLVPGQVSPLLCEDQQGKVVDHCPGGALGTCTVSCTEEWEGPVMFYDVPKGTAKPSTSAASACMGSCVGGASWKPASGG